MDRKSLDKNARILIAIFTSVIVIIGIFNFTSLGDPVRDYFADTVEGTETVWINTTEYIPIYFNFTEWFNSTQWINSTEYIPIWYNQTIWTNGTVWINNTEIVYVPVWYNITIWINSTTFVNYPFVSGWNVSGSLTFVKLLKSGSGGSTQYKLQYYDQYNQVTQTGGSYMSYTLIKALFVSLYTSPYHFITLQQYDNVWIQLFILANS